MIDRRPALHVRCPYGCTSFAALTWWAAVEPRLQLAKIPDYNSSCRVETLAGNKARVVILCFFLMVILPPILICNMLLEYIYRLDEQGNTVPEYPFWTACADITQVGTLAHR